MNSYYLYVYREKVRQWIASQALRLQRGWGALGGNGGALEQLVALACALPKPHEQRTALTALRDALNAHDVSPFEVNVIIIIQGVNRLKAK